MASKSGDPSILTDSDVDALAWRFLSSAYAEKTYADCRWTSASTVPPSRRHVPYR